MAKNLKSHLKRLLEFPIQWICRWEYQHQRFTRFNERPIEYSFVFRNLTKIYPLKILDVGTGTTALPHLMRNCGCLVTAVDNFIDYWASGTSNRHYHVINDDITNTNLDDKFNFITCISTLEHIENFDAAMRNMFSLLMENGYLLISFPYNENQYCKNVYELPGSSYGQDATYITQAFSREDINRWLNESGGKIIEQEWWCFWTGDYWTVGEQIIPPVKVGPHDKHQLTCLLIGLKK